MNKKNNKRFWIYLIIIITIFSPTIWKKNIFYYAIRVLNIYNKYNYDLVYYLHSDTPYSDKSRVGVKVPWGISKTEVKLITIGKLISETDNKLTFSDREDTIEYYFNNNGKFYEAKEIYRSLSSQSPELVYTYNHSIYYYSEKEYGSQFMDSDSLNGGINSEIFMWKDDNGVEKNFIIEGDYSYNYPHKFQEVLGVKDIEDVHKMILENDLVIKYDKVYSDIIYMSHSIKKDSDSKAIREFCIGNSMLKD